MEEFVTMVKGYMPKTMRGFIILAVVIAGFLIILVGA